MHRKVMASKMSSYIHPYRCMLHGITELLENIVVLYHLIALTIDTTAMYGATVYFLFLFFVGLNFLRNHVFTKKALIKCRQNIAQLFINGYLNRVLTTMMIHRLAIQESCSWPEALSQGRQDRFQTRGDCYME